MSEITDDDEMWPESESAVDDRREEVRKIRPDANHIRLEPDVAKVFKDSDSVNRALRMLIQLAREEVTSNTQRNPGERGGL